MLNEKPRNLPPPAEQEHLEDEQDLLDAERALADYEQNPEDAISFEEYMKVHRQNSTT